MPITIVRKIIIVTNGPSPKESGHCDCLVSAFLAPGWICFCFLVDLLFAWFDGCAIVDEVGGGRTNSTAGPMHQWRRQQTAKSFSSVAQTWNGNACCGIELSLVYRAPGSKRCLLLFYFLLLFSFLFLFFSGAHLGVLPGFSVLVCIRKGSLR